MIDKEKTMKPPLHSTDITKMNGGSISVNEVDPLVDYLKQMVVKDTDRRRLGRLGGGVQLVKLGPCVPGRCRNEVFIGSYPPHPVTVGFLQV